MRESLPQQRHPVCYIPWLNRAIPEYQARV
jgi:hypothetical protein